MALPPVVSGIVDVIVPEAVEEVLDRIGVIGGTPLVTSFAQALTYPVDTYFVLIAGTTDNPASTDLRYVRTSTTPFYALTADQPVSKNALAAPTGGALIGLANSLLLSEWVAAQPRVSLREFGMVGSGDETAKFLTALSEGVPLVAEKDKIYSISAVSISGIGVDLDLNSSALRGTSEADRMITAEYPYEATQDVISVNLSARSIVVANVSLYALGDRLKIASRDRCAGNRAAPGDGRDYWQAQTLTVIAISTGTNAITFAEPFETDFTFATTPKVMRVPVQRAVITNGRLFSEKGFADTRSNGLVTIRGGSAHLFDRLAVENANGTALTFIGSDGPTVMRSRLLNVGRRDDSEGSHGASFVACNAPQYTENRSRRCRHAWSNNDTPTQWADANYSTMGPTYDLISSQSLDEANTAASFATHHGLRRASIDSCFSIGASGFGFGIRGWDVRVTNCGAIGTDVGFFVYSETTDFADADRTRRALVSDCYTQQMTVADIQFQRLAEQSTVGDNNFNGNAPRAYWFVDAGTVCFTGHAKFKSNAQFKSSTTDEGSGYSVGTNLIVESGATLKIDATAMTPNLTPGAIFQSVIYHTNGDFRSDGHLALDPPPLVASGSSGTWGPSSGAGDWGYGEVLKKNGTGTLLVRDLLYSNKANPLNNVGSGLTLGAQIRRRDNTYSFAYQSKTAAASYDLNLFNALDPQVTVTMALPTGTTHSLASISNGAFPGQRLLLRVVDASGAGTFTIPSSLSNFDLRASGASGNLTLPNRTLASFVWTGAVWALESRTL